MSNWAPLPARDVAFVMSKAGYLTGLEGLEAGRGLRVKPFVLSSRRDGSLIQQDTLELDAGLDLKYGITPKLTLDLTYRTDFSQVEVDQQQLNLSRFSPFFQERREFFIENQGTFTFGDVSRRDLRSGVSTRDFSLFHSRRIGLSEEGKADPAAGRRATNGPRRRRRVRSPEPSEQADHGDARRELLRSSGQESSPRRLRHRSPLCPASQNQR